LKFGPRPLAECAGAILAHAVYLADGRIAKGTRLSPDHLARLAASGLTEIIVACLEASDLDENAAADTIAAEIMPENVDFSDGVTGRVNVYAPVRGLLRFDRARLAAVNRIDEGITLATVQHNQLVEAGDMIATLKVIPYGVPSDSVKSLIECASGSPIISFHALRPRSLGLIQTRIEGMKPKIIRATEDTTKARLNQLGCALVDSRVVPHDVSAVRDAIDAAGMNAPEILLICGGSAISDRRDVVPTAIVAAGGRVDHFGLPVDPGNLLMTAQIDKLPVIGMPGCARSTRLNGFDWVLHLLLAGLPIDDAEIADMAAGGLLMEIASRPLPRRLVEQKRTADMTIGGVLLAAGQSKRMGENNKLLMEVDGAPLVRRAARALLEGGLQDVVVVTGHQSDAVKAALADLPLRFVDNPDYADGQAGSVAAGIRVLAESNHAGALVALGDMPFVKAGLVQSLIRDHVALADAEDRITFPVYDGQRGNPVLWGRRFFDSLMALSGDTGGRAILAQNAGAVNSFSWNDASIHQDIDTPEGLASAQASAAST